jgi:uncharacterized membrane protein
MRRLVQQRQRGQTIVLAAVAMVAIVGGLAMVVDLGIFVVAQRHLQTAADAGALAGAWRVPICPNSTPPTYGCLPAQPLPPEDANHDRHCTGVPGVDACDLAQVNANAIAQLCGGSIRPPTLRTGTQLERPRNVNTIVVTVECDAPYSFGRILNLTTPKHITASAAAAIGNRQATVAGNCLDGGDITDLVNPPPCGYIARLIH